MSWYDPYRYFATIGPNGGYFVADTYALLNNGYVTGPFNNIDQAKAFIERTNRNLMSTNGVKRYIDTESNDFTIVYERVQGGFALASLNHSVHAVYGSESAARRRLSLLNTKEK